MIIEQFCVKKRNSFGIEDWNCHSKSHWAGMTLKERISLIREKRVKFYDEHSQEVPSSAAVKKLISEGGL